MFIFCFIALCLSVLIAPTSENSKNREREVYHLKYTTQSQSGAKNAKPNDTTTCNTAHAKEEGVHNMVMRSTRAIEELLERVANIEDLLAKKCHIEPAVSKDLLPDREEVIQESNKSSCENFDNKFGNFGQKYCVNRDGATWTVIQRRDNYPSPQNFNVSWSDYKKGFGHLGAGFWLGNDVISKMSRETQLVLRIELEDFEGGSVWAQYSTFKVLSEVQRYKLIVGGYTGNASDALTSHNGSLFSTFDRKNDQAPTCCPCAVSYGGGWWFNSCFESNLNGVYYKKPRENGYFGGIIWENWRGDYSLKKTLMMVKPQDKSMMKTTAWPYYEDP